MVRLNENIVGIDSAIFMHPKIWEASGLVGAFNDPLIDNKDSKKRYRADVLLEDYIAKIEDKIEKEVEKGRKRFGEAFDEAQFRATNPNVLRNLEKAADVKARMNDCIGIFSETIGWASTLSTRFRLDTLITSPTTVWCKPCGSV